MGPIPTFGKGSFRLVTLQDFQHLSSERKRWPTLFVAANVSQRSDFLFLQR